MAASNISINVHDHGIALDDKKKKVQCNYCGKVVSGFYRLKCHLGGIRGDVVPCQLVPSNIKEHFNTKLNDVKRKNLVKEVDNLQHPDLPFKRTRNTALLQDNEPEDDEVSVSTRRKKEKETSTSGGDGSIEQALLPNGGSKPKFKELLRSKTNDQVDLKSLVPWPQKTQQCISKFFYETGVDLTVANSSSFNQMINANHKQGETRYKPPTCMELRGSMLREEVKSMKEYVKKVKESWSRTGCSILLDEWVSVKGRDFVNFLVDCPEGTIYIRSSDLTAYVGDINALRAILEEVIDEVGVENVVQIITSSNRCQLWRASSQIVEQHQNMSRAPSASFFIGIILERMGKLKPFNEILNKAKTFATFIHGHAMVLKLFRFNSRGNDLVKPHKIISVMPYLTLGNIVSQKQYLKELFASSEWNNSSWAFSVEGKWAADLLEDHFFWKGAKILLKATAPFVRILCQIHETQNKLQVGYLYESFRQAKEEIKKQIVQSYTPFWNVIDEIWDIYLVPLHTAGYYLNPCIFFSKEFCSDSEVEYGLKCCIEKMEEDLNLRALIYQQLEEYKERKGAFEAGSSTGAVKHISPVEWWFRYGAKCPELHKFAIRVLSQTCDGALRYGLRRRLAEKLLTNGRNCIEQQRLKDLTFVHYNLQLQNLKFNVVEEMDPMDDWTEANALETMSPS